MSFRQEISLDSLPPSEHRNILKMLLEELGYRIMCKREWIGAPAKFELERKDRPTPIVKEQPHGRGFKAGKKLP